MLGKRIQSSKSRFQNQLIDVSSKLLDLIDQKNLRWPLIFCFMCFFAFWAETINYHYYKYYTKWLPIVAVAVHMMVHLENLDKAFYDKFSYADYTAIGFIISIPGDVLYMIEDNNMGLMPGLCMFLIMNLWYALSFLPLLYYHHRHKLTKTTPASNWLIFVGCIAGCGIAYANAELILSVAEYNPTYLSYSYAILQGIMVSLQFMRRRLTLRRSFGYTCTGTIFDLVGTCIFYMVRAKVVEHWIFRLLWISLHYFGQFLLSRGMLIHCWWWEKQLLIKKAHEDKLKKIEYEKKRAEYLKKKEEEEKRNLAAESIQRNEQTQKDIPSKISETVNEEKQMLNSES